MSASYPSLNRFFLIGKALKSHGTGGHLRLMIEDQFKVYMKKGSFVFFDLNGSKVPYKVADIDDGAHFVIALEDVPDKRGSDQLGGMEMWIPFDMIKTRHQRSPRNIRDKWHEYRIEDEKTHALHEVIRVEEFPQQLIAVISIGQKEILIPLSDQLISSIDKENKIISMNIPEGLLDL